MGTVNTLQRSELKGGFFCFIPIATVISGTPVSKTSWPALAADYEAWRFKDIETLKRERKVDTRTRQVPVTTGGYEEQNKKSLKGQSFIGTTAQTNGVLKQLENGLASIAVAGVPQKFMDDRQADIEGVGLIELVDEETGIVVDAIQCWGRLSLDAASDASPEVSTLTFRFDVINAALNTFETN